MSPQPGEIATLLPADLPAALRQDAHQLLAAAHRADLDVGHLLRRSLRHSTCSGDGSVVTLLRSDAAALTSWVGEARSAAGAIKAVSSLVATRLNQLANVELLCRASLRRPDLRAATASAVSSTTMRALWGPGPWLSTVAGAVRLPHPGDPAWWDVAQVMRM